MKRIVFLTLIFILVSCDIQSPRKSDVKNSLYIALEVNKKYTPLICDAIQDFVSDEAFKLDSIFQVDILMRETETADIVISIYSLGDEYKDLYRPDILAVAPHPLSLYKIGTYNKGTPNKYWRVGKQVVLWNDQDSTNRITSELKRIVSYYI